MSGYCHNSLALSKKRSKRKKKTCNTFSSPDKRRVMETTRGSWYNQEALSGAASSSRRTSSSENKIFNWSAYDEENSNYSSENEEEISSCYSHWIMDVELLQEYLEKHMVCNVCFSSVKLTEIETARAGIATKFKLCCYFSEDWSNVQHKQKIRFSWKSDWYGSKSIAKSF